MIILGFYYFEWVSESSWAFRTLKESKTKLILCADLADFLTQSPLGNVDVKYQVREPLRDPQSNFELRNTLSELKEAPDGPAG